MKAYIADGHHRYATALRYRDAHGPDGAWTLGYFTPMDTPGLVIEPYHRILSAGPTRDEAETALAARFDLRGADSVGEAATRVARSTRPYAFALAWPDAPALVAESKDDGEGPAPPGTPPSLRVLDTYFLHRAVLGPILSVPDEAVSYVHSLGEAERAAPEADLPPRGPAARHARPPDRGRGGGGGVDAGQEHVLPPEAALGSRHPSAGRLTRRPAPGGPTSRALPSPTRAWSSYKARSALVAPRNSRPDLPRPTPLLGSLARVHAAPPARLPRAAV